VRKTLPSLGLDADESTLIDYSLLARKKSEQDTIRGVLIQDILIYGCMCGIIVVLALDCMNWRLSGQFILIQVWSIWSR